MSTLVLTNRQPWSSANGYDLRVFSLCQFIDGPRHLLVIPLNASNGERLSYDVDAVFSSVETVRPATGAPSVRRHFRTSDAEFLRLAYPRGFTAAVERVREIIAHRRITKMVVFGANLAGLAREVAFPSVLLDVCDSPSLATARSYLHDGSQRSLAERVRARVHLWRSQRCEAALPSWFNQVTTINRADSEQVVRLHGRRTLNVHTVPNGVGEGFLAPLGSASAERGVAFWGNLHFRPNREAMRYFFASIYAPYLRTAGLKVRIVGRNPEPWLLDMARSDPQIRLMGFVDDLAAAVTDCPVMINPMVIGGGLKNKVLEAFGLGLTVVSTSLGVEAFPEAVAGKHYVLSDEPQAFAEAVLGLLGDNPRRERVRADARSLLEAHYRWEVIGRRWNELCRST